MRLDVDKNTVRACSVFSDSLCTDTADIIATALKEQPYTPQAVRDSLEVAAAQCAARSQVEAAEQVRDVAAWLREQM